MKGPQLHFPVRTLIPSIPALGWSMIPPLWRFPLPLTPSPRNIRQTALRGRPMVEQTTSHYTVKLICGTHGFVELHGCRLFPNLAAPDLSL